MVQICRFIALLMFVVTPGIAIAQPDEPVDEQAVVLHRELKGLAAECRRMLIRYQRIPLVQGAVAPLAFDEVEEQVLALDDASEEDIDRFHLSLYSDRVRRAVLDAGGRFTGGQSDLHVDGDTYRNSVFTPDRRKEGTVKVGDGKNTVHWQSFLGQCSLSRPRQIIVERFRFYPCLDDMLSGAMENYTHVPTDPADGELMYQSAVLGDSITTFQFRWPSCELTQQTIARRTNSRTDRYYYCRFVETPQGRSVPTLLYHFTFDQQQKLMGAEIRIVQEYLFGDECPKVNLRVYIPTDTTIVDTRLPGERRVLRTHGPVRDVVELMDIRAN